MATRSNDINSLKSMYDEIPIDIIALNNEGSTVYLNKKVKKTGVFKTGDKVALGDENCDGFRHIVHREEPFAIKNISSSKGLNVYTIYRMEEIEPVVEPSHKFKERQKFFQDVLDKIYDQIFVIDKTGKVIMINEAVIKRDYHRDDIVGKTMKELIEIGFANDALCYEILEQRTSIGKMFKEEQGYDLMSWGVPHFGNKGEIDFIVFTEWDMENLDYLQGLITGEGKKNKDKYKPELEYYRNRISTSDEIIGKSPRMQEFLQTASKLARSDATVLIYGESGTGKELLTKYIYNNSPRASGPLIEVNCGAIPENLIESELFGYEKGAFTSANEKGKIGLFEAAQNGTILLDEVSELPFVSQAKLLRALQEKEIYRVGGNVALPVDVRVIAATNTDLKIAVEERRFREDLYYRLNVLPIHVPPLRERIEDIPDLIRYFVDRVNHKQKTNKKFNERDLDLLCNYSWPGNVRELKNLIERVMVITSEDTIPRSAWVTHLMQPKNIAGDPNRVKSIDLKKEVEEYEKELITTYFPLYENSRQFADFLGTDKSTINRKLKKYGIRE